MKEVKSLFRSRGLLHPTVCVCVCVNSYMFLMHLLWNILFPLKDTSFDLFLEGIMQSPKGFQFILSLLCQTLAEKPL